MDEMLWEAFDPSEPIAWQGGAVSLRIFRPGGACLVSGEFDAAAARHAPGAPLLGLAETAPEGPFSLRISRDRILLITPQPLAIKAGWHREGYLLTPADDLYVGVGIDGAGALDLVCSLCDGDLPDASPSAGIHVAGIQCLLVGRKGGYAILCERPMLRYLAEVAIRTAKGLEPANRPRG